MSCSSSESKYEYQLIMCMVIAGVLLLILLITCKFPKLLYLITKSKHTDIESEVYLVILKLAIYLNYSKSTSCTSTQIGLPAHYFRQDKTLGGATGTWQW